MVFTGHIKQGALLPIKFSKRQVNAALFCYFKLLHRYFRVFIRVRIDINVRNVCFVREEFLLFV